MAGPNNTQFAVATHIATLLADMPEEPVNSEFMAGSIGTNAAHVRRLLGHLRRAGIVTSRSGPNGGWRLARAADDVTLADLWRAIYEEAPLLAMHNDTSPACPVGNRIKGTLGRVRSRLIDTVELELAGITVADVLNDTLGIRELTVTG
jgi:Rrf2 family protein